MFSFTEHGCNIIGLILYPFAIVCIAGSHAEIPDFHTAQSCFIKAAGGDIQPCPINRMRNNKHLPKAVHWVALFFIDCVVAGNPCRLPVAFFQKSRFKRGFRPLARFVIFIPETNLPGDMFPAFQHDRIHSAHGGTFHFAALPFFRHDFIGSLPDAAFRIPHQAGLLQINADRIFQIFCSQADCFHVPFLLLQKKLFYQGTVYKRIIPVICRIVLHICSELNIIVFPFTDISSKTRFFTSFYEKTIQKEEFPHNYSIHAKALCVYCSHKQQKKRNTRWTKQLEQQEAMPGISALHCL